MFSISGAHLSVVSSIVTRLCNNPNLLPNSSAVAKENSLTTGAQPLTLPFARVSLAACAFGVTDNTCQSNSRPWRFISLLCSLGTTVGVTLNFGSSLYTWPVFSQGVWVGGAGGQSSLFLN